MVNKKKEIGVSRKWKGDNLCSVLSHRTDASVSSDFTTFSWPIRVKDWLKMGAVNACWKTSQIVIPAQGQTETCSKLFLAVWITYQIQWAKTPSHGCWKSHTSSGLFLARGFCLIFSGKQGAENRLLVLQLKRKEKKRTRFSVKKHRNGWKEIYLLQNHFSFSGVLGKMK